MVEAYPLISKVCRDEAQHKKTTHVHHCHGSMVAAGFDYDDLNQLFKEPQNLEFTFGNEIYIFIFVGIFQSISFVLGKMKLKTRTNLKNKKCILSMYRVKVIHCCDNYPNKLNVN